jgi:uncharacterized protein YkwD
VRLALALALALGVAGCGALDGVTGTVERPTRTVTIEQPPPTATAERDPDDGSDLETGECENVDLQPDGGNLRAIEEAARCLVDVQRGLRDRAPLRADSRLAGAARAKARDMVAQEYFAHIGPDGREVEDWVRDTDYLSGAGGYGLGENLGWASAGAATPRRLVQGWMDSDSHRRNILRAEWEETGMGVVLGDPSERSRGGAVYVQMFGRTG